MNVCAIGGMLKSIAVFTSHYHIIQSHYHDKPGCRAPGYAGRGGTIVLLLHVQRERRGRWRGEDKGGSGKKHLGGVRNETRIMQTLKEREPEHRMLNIFPLGVTHIY